MSKLPERWSPEGAPRRIGPAARHQAATELALFRHSLGARFMAEADRIDSEAAADALRSALASELDLLDHGLSRAGCSAAKVDLVAQKVEALAELNRRRFARRFGA